MDFNGTGLIERPDLTPFRNSRGHGGIQLRVAGRNLEPVSNLKRAEPRPIRRWFRTHDENVGVKLRIGGEKFPLR